MDKLPGHKERSLAWLRGLEEAQTSWATVEIVPNERMTVESIGEKYGRWTVADNVTLHHIMADINCLLRDMVATPDLISSADADALAELVRLRNNLQIQLHFLRN